MTEQSPYEVRHDAGVEGFSTEEQAQDEAERLRDKYGYDCEVVETEE